MHKIDCLHLLNHIKSNCKYLRFVGMTNQHTIRKKCYECVLFGHFNYCYGIEPKVMVFILWNGILQKRFDMLTDYF